MNEPPLKSTSEPTGVPKPGSVADDCRVVNWTCTCWPSLLSRVTSYLSGVMPLISGPCVTIVLKAGTLHRSGKLSVIEVTRPIWPNDGSVNEIGRAHV